MEETYIVAWAVWSATDDEFGQSMNQTDYWERCETLEEAQELYNKVVEDPELYTASIGKEIQSTEA